jgi:hypothetical protein
MSHKSERISQSEARVPHPSPAFFAGQGGHFPRQTIQLLVALLLAFCELALPFSAIAQKPSAKPTADLPPGAMQAKATTSCLECHEARIILQQRLSKAAWTREVDKMIKWGAIVDAADRDALIDYLSTNFNPDQPAYEAPRSAVSGKK